MEVLVSAWNWRQWTHPQDAPLPPPAEPAAASTVTLAQLPQSALLPLLAEQPTPGASAQQLDAPMLPPAQPAAAGTATLALLPQDTPLPPPAEQPAPGASAQQEDEKTPTALHPPPPLRRVSERLRAKRAASEAATTGGPAPKRA